MTDWASEHQICIKFCIKLEHSSAETIRVTQKATAMGNGWSEASSQQHARSGITSRVDFLAKHQNCQVTQPCYRPDLVPCDFWLFPKLKSFPWKGKRFQTIDKIQENTIGQLMTTRRTVWGPKVSMLKGTEASLSYVQCVLHLISSSINVYIFHITWLDTFWIYIYISEWKRVKFSNGDKIQIFQKFWAAFLLTIKTLWGNWQFSRDFTQRMQLLK